MRDPRNQYGAKRTCGEKKVTGGFGGIPKRLPRSGPKKVLQKKGEKNRMKKVEEGNVTGGKKDKNSN